MALGGTHVKDDRPGFYSEGAGALAPGRLDARPCGCAFFHPPNRLSGPRVVIDPPVCADNARNVGIALRAMKLFDEQAMMRDDHDTMRYTLELDLLERDATLGDSRATALLRSEFARAVNASYLAGLSAGDIEVGAIGRSIPQEGVARYAVELVLRERTPSLTDEQAAELLAREFARAQNASHFIRIASDDFGVRLAAREPVVTHAALRAA